VSANSNSNIDLDRGGSITARHNGQDGVQLEDSLLNLFNMPGLPGSRVEATENGRHGLSAFLESRIDLSGNSVATSQENGDAGVLVDNGSFVRLVNSTVTSNTRGVVLSFGSRADLTGNTIDSLTCDGTVLVRSNDNTACP
jgi:parallel beta-helix repeat protein